MGRAGNRVSQSVGGTATRFGYNPAGQTTESLFGCVLGAIGSVLGISASAFRAAIEALQDASRVLDKGLAILGIKGDLVGFFAGLRDQLEG